jgi:hypothetical protein
MTTDLNTQPGRINILDDADLDAVTGGGNVIDGVSRAVLSYNLNRAVLGYLEGEILRDGQKCW